MSMNIQHILFVTHMNSVIKKGEQEMRALLNIRLSQKFLHAAFMNKTKETFGTI